MKVNRLKTQGEFYRIFQYIPFSTQKYANLITWRMSLRRHFPDCAKWRLNGRIEGGY